MLTPEQKLAQILGIITDTPPVAVNIVWYKDTSTPTPTVPLADQNDEKAIKDYMAHGFRANLKRGVAESDWNAMLSYCDRIYAAKTPQEADAVISGAGQFTPDVAVLLVLGGGAQGFGPFQSPAIFAPWGSGFDIVGASAWLCASPGTAGPGGQ